MGTSKSHTRNKDSVLTTDGITALLDAGFLKRNLLVDDGFNIQIDEIRARDLDGLKLFDDGGSGIFVKDGGDSGFGTTNPLEKVYAVGGNVGGALNETQTARWSLGSTSSSVDLKTLFPTALRFGTNNLTRMAILPTGNIGIGTISPDITAKLQIDSTTQGVLNPRLTTAQKDAIVSPATGLRIFDTDLKHHEFFNGTKWKGLETGATNVVFFTSQSQLPAPVGGVITLEENTVYVMYNDDPSAGQKQVIFTDRIQIPDVGGTRITGIGLATALLLYTGTETFLTTSDTFTGFFSMDNLFVSCPNGAFLDIDGILPVGQEFFPRIFLTEMAIFDTDTIGIIKTISCNFNIGAFFSCKQGLILDGVEEALIGDWRFANWKNDANSVMITTKNMLRFPKIQNCTFETAINETAFNVVPSIGDETFIIAGNSYRGTGNLYATGISGVIVSITDASQVGSVTAVAGTPFGEVIMTDVAHGLVEREIIVTSGFADPNYNGTFEVLEIIDSDNFRIHALFTSTGTGSLNSNRIIVSDVAHGLAVGDGVQLVTNDLSLGYNKGYRIFSATADTFIVNAVFTGTDTGTWNTNSLTEADPRMRVVANAGMPDSRTIGAYIVDSNTIATSLTSGVWTDLDLGGNVAPASNIERFVVTNTTTGEIRYIGTEAFSGIITFTAYVTSVGGANDFMMRAVKNGLTLPDTFEPVQNVGSDKKHYQIIVPVELVNGDLIRPQAFRVDGTSTLTISDMSMKIS